MKVKNGFIYCRWFYCLLGLIWEKILMSQSDYFTNDSGWLTILRKNSAEKKVKIPQINARCLNKKNGWGRFCGIYLISMAGKEEKKTTEMFIWPNPTFSYLIVCGHNLIKLIAFFSSPSIFPNNSTNENKRVYINKMNYCCYLRIKSAQYVITDSGWRFFPPNWSHAQNWWKIISAKTWIDGKFFTDFTTDFFFLFICDLSLYHQLQLPHPPGV